MMIKVHSGSGGSRRGGQRWWWCEGGLHANGERGWGQREDRAAVGPVVPGAKSEGDLVALFPALKRVHVSFGHRSGRHAKVVVPHLVVGDEPHR